LDYDPLHRYTDLDNYLDFMPALMAELNRIVNSANWDGKARLTRGNLAPKAIRAMRDELTQAVSDEAKLLALKNEVTGKTGRSLVRTAKATEFYKIVAKIPANVDQYGQPATSNDDNGKIAVALSRVLRELRNFQP
jgi:hypothetical protein